jgi:hypothetical protein
MAAVERLMLDRIGDVLRLRRYPGGTETPASWPSSAGRFQNAELLPGCAAPMLLALNRGAVFCRVVSVELLALQPEHLRAHWRESVRHG